MMMLLSFIRAFSSLFTMMTISATALAQTQSDILLYDKSGKATEYKSQELDNKGENAGETDGSGTSGKSSLSEKEPFDPDTQYEQGEVLVLNPPEMFSSDIRALGFKVAETLKLEGMDMEVWRLHIPSGMNVPVAIQKLLSRFPNLIIEANHNYNPSGDNISFPKKLARALYRWTNAPVSCGKGLRIGMIDGGVDLTHPALKGQKITFRSFHKKDREPGPKDHGTAVAGILVGVPKWGGLLPGASLFAANFIEYNELGRRVGSAMGLLKAIKWLINKNVDIVNLSITGADNKILRRLVNRALKKQMVMVAAAGSWGRTDKPAYPAAYKGIFAVTAMGMDGKIYRKANAGKYIDFAAPGVLVYTAASGGAGQLRSGTSFAVPFVTALMGVEILNGRATTYSQLNNILQNKAKDLGAPGRDDVFGWGFVWQPPDC